jgi:hypothetical protein
MLKRLEDRQCESIATVIKTRKENPQKLAYLVLFGADAFTGTAISSIFKRGGVAFFKTIASTLAAAIMTSTTAKRLRERLVPPAFQRWEAMCWDGRYERPQGVQSLRSTGAQDRPRRRHEQTDTYRTKKNNVAGISSPIQSDRKEEFAS